MQTRIILLLFILDFFLFGCTSNDKIKKEIEDCRKLPEIGTFFNGKYNVEDYPQDKCIIEVAYNNSDPSVCEQVKNRSIGPYVFIDNIQFYCYNIIAKKTKNPKLCHGSNEYEYQNCLKDSS